MCVIHKHGEPWSWDVEMSSYRHIWLDASAEANNLERD